MKHIYDTHNMHTSTRCKSVVYRSRVHRQTASEVGVRHVALREGQEHISPLSEMRCASQSDSPEKDFLIWEKVECAFSLRRQAMAVSDSDSHAFVQQLYNMSSSTTTDESIGLRSATLETWSHELLVFFQRRLSATHILPNQILGRLLASLSSSHGCWLQY
jgi:hypothetical protein